MPQYDLAGNPLPEARPQTASSDAPVAVPMANAPQRVLPAAPTSPTPGPNPQLVPQAILMRGVAQETPAQRVRAYSGLAGTLLLLVLLTYAVAAIPPPAIPTPAAYMPYTSAEAAITCDAPEGWTRRDGMASLSWKDKEARIEIDAPPQDEAGGYAPLNALHMQTQDELANAFADGHYTEQTAQALQTGMGVGLLSEWSAAPGLTHLRGLRATLMSGNNAVLVVCQCPARDWKALRPAFLHVIQSITPTTGSPQSVGGN